MTDSTKNIELIERYFDDEMTDGEKEMFHQQLKSDVALKHLYDRENLLINTVRFGAAKNHLAFLKELETSLPEVSVDKEDGRWLRYAVAASVVIVLLAGVYYFKAGKQTPTELYAEYFSPYPNAFERNVRGSQDAERSEAFRAYENKDYDRAAVLFTRILDAKEDPAVLLLLGNANLAVGKTAEAKNNFKDLISTYDDLDIQGKWYLSLCYLREGQIQSAHDLLNEIVAEGVYAEKAKDLLTKIETIR